jgi:short-subunit dehydrogenase
MASIIYPHCSLEGKVAIITGSTQGLGEATARLFKERGIRGLILTGRNAERGSQLVESLTDDTCSAHFVQADLIAR